jgi:glycosyltransferase involved in cell wall biosynthesis
MANENLVSVIIPSRNEKFLGKTVQDLLAKAEGKIEIIVVLEGYWPVPQLVEDNRLIIVHRGEAMGMRNAINAAAAIARGKYLLKCDAHCMFDTGFDKKLAADCEDNWIVIPRRKKLDAENWCIDEYKKRDVDYQFLTCPMTNNDGYTMHGQIWPERDRARRNDPRFDIDDNMSFQGSCWFMAKEHFDQRLRGMHEEGYGTFCQEAQELGNKTWLGGGRVVTNKKTWYAHLHKGKKYGRGYFQNMKELVAGNIWSAHHWMNNEEPRMVYKMEWLIDKFWPVPSWPEDWKKRINESVR